MEIEQEATVSFDQDWIKQNEKVKSEFNFLLFDCMILVFIWQLLLLLLISLPHTFPSTLSIDGNIQFVHIYIRMKAHMYTIQSI